MSTDYVTYKSRKISHKFVTKKVCELKVGDLIFTANKDKMIFRGQVFNVPQEFNSHTFVDIYNGFSGVHVSWNIPNQTVIVMELSQ